MIEIRHARTADASGINRIGNHYINITPANFKTEPLTLEERETWINSFSESGPYQLFIAEEDNSILGYAGSTKFHDRTAYDTSVATAIYLDPNACTKGIGTRLYTQLFQALAKEDLNRAFAGITIPNPASEALHLKFGFKKVGIFTEAGRKYDKYWDVLWLEKNL
ncbi:MAG: GNAT family N-acetyltransferase [Verrucomicrobia bacterium]|nr:GNAT family N-acetyltransferase [Verrucomicrobiota bacterium]MDA1066588.1 GNAT family N-acetyltransferase [Verrucomicrobiota bacterium]